MAVYDQWHRAPREGDVPCSCGTKRSPLYPGAEHGRGRRWLVRYRTPDGRQPGRSFDVKVGKDPNRHADAFDKMIAEQLRTDSYADPSAGEVTLQAYAEAWRKGRGHDPERAAYVAAMLRNHVYEGEPDSGKTVKGGVAIGQHQMRALSRLPSLTQAWITAMPLAPSSALQVVEIVSAVYGAAEDDGIVGRDPTRSKSVTRPSAGRTRARPWTAERVAAVRDALPARYQVIPELGAGTGMRQGEMFGLAADDVQFLGRRPEVAVTRQVKLVQGQLHYGPVKNRKPHAVPLAPSLALALARHMERFPPREVTLPWHEPGNRERHGQPVTARLILTAAMGGALRRQDFDARVWRPALVAAGVTPTRQDGCHALRHTFASVQLRARVDVARVAAWLGDTVQMTVRTYVHLLPRDDDSDGRAAVDAFLLAASGESAGEALDGGATTG